MVNKAVYSKCCKSEDALYPTVNWKQRGTGHEKTKHKDNLIENELFTRISVKPLQRIEHDQIKSRKKRLNEVIKDNLLGAIREGGNTNNMVAAGECSGKCVARSHHK